MPVTLDNITGGGLLPHVYCRKVTLETNSVNADLTDVTLLLELYHDKNALSNSAWLNNLSFGNMNFLDAMFIQVVPFRRHSNVVKLRPSNNPTIAGGNVYTGKYHFVDNYLPRGVTSGPPAVPEQIFQSFDTPPPPIQVSNSSLLGNIAGSDILSALDAEGKVREEIVNGKPYYVIPFEFTLSSLAWAYDASAVNNDLGFAFYTFLDVPFWASAVGYSLGDSMIAEELVVKGPVNTEIVFVSGQVQQTRDAFFLPNGQIWEGSVHLHATGINEAPGGYSGTGGLSGDTTGAEYQGWMVGESHNPSQEQPKLRLAQVPNNKISDFRTSGILNGKLLSAIDEQAIAFKAQDAFDKDLAGVVGAVFQKDKKRYFIGDNDSEYSKLYLSKDVDGTAHGMFFVNLEELLKNNSSLFSLLPNISENSTAISEILEKSNVLELKVYRDRVERHTNGNRRENYANDEFYEEPSKLIATTSVNSLKSVNVKPTGLINSESKKIRYFVFADEDISKHVAGLYQYRLELRFKDGTYEYLYEMYKNLANYKVDLASYYDLAVSTYTDPAASTSNYVSLGTAKEFTKSAFKKYYQSGAFTSQFLSRANEMFPTNNEQPWEPSTVKHPISVMTTFFSLIGAISPGLLLSIEKMNPVYGSPAGIEFFNKLTGMALKKLETLLGINKVNKSKGSKYNELTSKSNVDGYTLQTILDTPVTPASYTILEYHTFDHPRELYEVSSNKNIYVDYLSVGTVTPMSPNESLKSISSGDFRKRCQLEAAKLSPLAKTLDGFKNADFGIGGALGFEAEADFLAKTGYSYLAPSVAAFSDPVSAGANYDFFYSIFSSNAYAYLDSDADASAMFSNQFNNVSTAKVILDNFLVALMNYSINKKEEIDSDLTRPYFSYNEVTDLDPSAALVLTVREPYKRAIEEMGMTLHDAAKHDETFLDNGIPKEPGAISIDYPEDNFKYNINDFSDGNLFPKNLFLGLLDGNNMFVNIADNSPAQHAYNISAPNNFKIAHIAATQGDDPPILQPLFKVPFTTNPATYNSLFYFLLNLTVKIEVFKGNTGNAKNDEDSWALLTGEDLDFIESEGSAATALFCRMSLYDEKLNKNMRLPILNEYFLIASDALPVVPEQDLSATSTAADIIADPPATIISYL